MLIICSMIYLKKRNKKYATVVQCRSIHPPYCGWDAWSIYQDPLLKPKYQFKSFYFTIFNLCKCAYLILQCIHWCFSSIESLECGRVFLVSYSIDKHTLRYALHLHVNKQRQFVKILKVLYANSTKYTGALEDTEVHTYHHSLIEYPIIIIKTNHMTVMCISVSLTISKRNRDP